ncbi:MAG: metallophosphoesterase [Coriobacteriia bacterium]|nr:metallophosphoesterase [Coriobacteriia bacterium]
MKNKALKYLGFTAAFILSFAIAHRAYKDTKEFEIKDIHIALENLPQDQDGLKIAHISDLHNEFFFKDPQDLAFEKESSFQSLLSQAIHDANPDIIVITGDLYDKRNPHIGKGLQIYKELARIAPVFWVTGNHDKTPLADGSTNASNTLADMENLGLHCIDNKAIKLSDSGLFMLGIEDPYGLDEDQWRLQLHRVVEEARAKGAKTLILLSHRPEQIKAYAEEGIDLTLSGHAHGGQVQAPLIGALYAPNQGLFPTFSAGLYEMDALKDGTYRKSLLYLSKGLGSTKLEFRFLSKAELAFITLHAKH